jgi:hypothetical protein
MIEIKKCSDVMFKLISRKDLTNENPLSQKSSRIGVPFNKLEVGQSLWVDIPNIDKNLYRAIILATLHFNKTQPGMFEKMKHRDGAAKTGFKYLEIVRIK